MRAKLALACGLFLFGILVAPFLAQELSPGVFRVAFPGKAWAVEIAAPGFTVRTNETKSDGRRYFFAENKENRVVLSVTLEQVKGTATDKECRGSLQRRLAPNPAYSVEDVQAHNLEGMATVEYTIPELANLKIQQKNILACLAKEDVYVDVHLSKVQFKPNDGQLLTTILHTIRFTEINGTTEAGSNTGQPTSWDYFLRGSRLYKEQKYREAIGPYQKALDLEKKDPKLSSTYWRVLVDNLGMSYGITGDLKSAQETFEHGLKKDPTYPLFYYNMACVYAEQKDLDNTMTYLNKAFEYKQNTIPGEKIPDPRKDNSFQHFMKNETFRKLAESLAASIN